MLDLRGDHDDRAGVQADGGLALLLIPALTGGTQQQLTAAARRVVDVLVVAAAGLEGNVRREEPALRVGQRVQEGIADKILRKGGIRRAGSEHVLLFKFLSILVLHRKNSPY